jgi:hypothetical protein
MIAPRNPVAQRIIDQQTALLKSMGYKPYADGSGYLPPPTTMEELRDQALVDQAERNMTETQAEHQARELKTLAVDAVMISKKTLLELAGFGEVDGPPKASEEV